MACIVLGLMFVFWGKLIQTLDMPKTERLVIGILFIAYAVLRFSRLFKVEPDEE
ncbi:MAG TPA: hypothetical protein VHE59_09600 [Mucilaginibacter sp.]|nr:hypothetical protein [Mucilaginibacter sp.]